MSLKTRAKIYLLLMEYTSVPLFIGLYVLFISGYGLVTRKAAWVTLGLITRHVSVLLHVLSPLPYLIGVLMALHALGGFGCLILRRVKTPDAVRILETVNFLVNAVFIIQLTILEFL